MSSVLSSDIQTMVTNFLRNTSTMDHNMVAGPIIYSRAGFFFFFFKKLYFHHADRDFSGSIPLLLFLLLSFLKNAVSDHAEQESSEPAICPLIHVAHLLGEVIYRLSVHL